MIKPELEFVYEAGGDLEAPREIGPVVDGTRRIIPIKSGGYVKGPPVPWNSFSPRSWFSLLRK